jgi:hypothetical protein
MMRILSPAHLLPAHGFGAVVFQGRETIIMRKIPPRCKPLAKRMLKNAARPISRGIV